MPGMKLSSQASEIPQLTESYDLRLSFTTSDFQIHFVTGALDQDTAIGPSSWGQASERQTSSVFGSWIDGRSNGIKRNNSNQSKCAKGCSPHHVLHRRRCRWPQCKKPTAMACVNNGSQKGAARSREDPNCQDPQCDQSRNPKRQKKGRDCSAIFFATRPNDHRKMP